MRRLGVVAALLLFAACKTDENNGNTTPPAAPAPVILEFVASVQSVLPGETVTLSYRVDNATSVTITAVPGGALIQDGVDLIGTITTAPLDATTRFSIVATGAVDPPAERTVSVTVDTTPVVINGFNAMPNPGPLGGTTDLSWQTANADRVRVLRGQTELVNSMTMTALGSVTVNLTATSTTFTLEAVRGRRSVSRDLVVMAQPLPTITRFDVTPERFASAPATVTLTWATTNATDVSLTADDIAIPQFPGAASGTFMIQISEATRFDLIARSAAGTIRETRTVARTTSEIEPNNTRADATDLGGGRILANIADTTDVDWFQIVVPAGGSVRAETSDGMAGCNVDTVLALVGPDGTAELVTNDNGGAADCSLIDPVVDLAASNLAQGTYYLTVTGAAMGDYVLEATVLPPTCSNGIIEGAEQCDDGNAVAGDGCSETCRIDPSRTVMGPRTTMLLQGAIATAGQRVSYQIQLADPGAIFAELFSAARPDCDFPGDLLNMTLRDSTGRELGVGDGSNFDRCSRIDPASEPWASLDRGNYFLDVYSVDPSVTVPAYELEVRTIAIECGNGLLEIGETCDDGNMLPGDGCNAACQFEGPGETEPNDDSARATATTLPTQIRGSLTPGAEFDWYRVEVPMSGMHLEAFVTANSFDRCSTNAFVDVALYASDGLTMLVSDAFQGPDGNCGRLAPDVALETFNMSAGTYYVVVSSRFDDVVPNYFLNVRLLAPECGNSLLEGIEQCDDGNVTGGDGCAMNCTLEIADTYDPPGRLTRIDLTPASRVLIVQLNLTVPGQSIRIVTSDGAGGCPTDTHLTLLDDSFAALGETDDGGPFPCAGVEPLFDTFAADLPTGTYYLAIRNRGIASQIELDVAIANPVCGDGLEQNQAGEECDDNNTVAGDGCSAMCRYEASIVQESEPNDDRATADDLGVTLTSSRTATGQIVPASDSDYYRFTVPVGQTATVIARTYSRIGTPADCRADTFLTLLDAQGAVLEDDDNDGSGVCAAIDGTTSSAASNLASGDYFLKVETFMGLSVASEYYMDVELR